MEKIKPNYKLFFLISLFVSFLTMLICYFVGTSNQLQVIALVILPFFSTFAYKHSYESSPFGYFINENEIIFKDSKGETSTRLADVVLKKGFFNTTLVLNNKKNIDLAFYNRAPLVKRLANIKL